VGKYRLGLRHAAGSAPLPGGELTFVRLDDVMAELAQVLHVLLRLPVGPHAVVHRRDEQHRGFGREETRGEQVVREAMRHAREKVRRRRRDDDRVRSLGERDVIERPPGLEQVGVHRPARQRLERHRPHELGRGTRQHAVDFRAGGRQQAREPSRLVARDSPRHAEDDSTAGEGAHAMTTGRGAAEGRGNLYRRL
jgi:hypothetical protein